MSGRGRLWIAVSAAALAGACAAPPKVCRAGEASRVRETMAARTESLGFGADRVLSLEECVTLALCNNLALRVQAMETQLADEDVREALTALLPRATAEYSKTQRSNEPEITGPAGGVAAFQDRKVDRFRTGALIPIFDFGATRFAWEIAKDERDQKRLAFARARQTLIRDVRVAFVRFAGAIEVADLVAAQVQAAREELRVARSLEREGLGSRADTAFVEATLARSELDLTSAGRDLLLARAGLARTLSVPTWTELKIKTSPPVAAPVAPGSKEAVLALEQIALRSRPELFSQDLERHAAASDVRSKFAEFFPKLGGNVAFEWSSNSLLVNNSWWEGGFIVAHSLLDSGATIIRYRKAKEQVRIEEERALLIGMSVLYEVDFRILELVRALDGIEAAEKLAAAQDALLTAVQNRYREGFASGADLSRALADRNSARRGLNDTRTESLATWFELLAAMGVDGLAPGNESKPASQPADAAATRETP